ncbi:hypothetical protein ACLB2K_004494 [Fragaria x ananassa]
MSAQGLGYWLQWQVGLCAVIIAGFAYFVLFSCLYITFQWTIHALGVDWWPYPFLELNTPWAPVCYFGLALVHIPCYWIYTLVVKAKCSIFTRLFPRAFVRLHS